MTVEAAEHAPTASEYIVHHLGHLSTHHQTKIVEHRLAPEGQRDAGKLQKGCACHAGQLIGRAGKVNAPPRPKARPVFDTRHQGPDGRRYRTPVRQS
jgi:hypothetical protein